MAGLDKYKQAILDVYQSTNKNIFVKATAGSGKTYLLLQLMKHTQPFKRCLFLAFNKSIAEELSRKVPDGIEVATIHSKAYKTLLGAFHYKPKIVENKNFLVAKKVISEETFGENRKRYFSYLYNIIGLYNLLNLNLAFTFEDARKVCEMYGEEMDEYLWKDITAIDIKRTKDESRLQTNGFCELDFTDMLLLTYKYVPDERFPKYDVVFLDECLPYYTPVICEGGVHLPIGKIVDERLPIKVLTFNHETGKQEYKEVINWSKSLNNKKCIKICGKQRKKNGKNSFITCTFNHKIWVKGKGYICAEDIVPGDIIQYETSAIKTQKYKVSLNGKKVLANSMKLKNYSPVFKQNRKSYNVNFKSRGGNGRINELQHFFFSKLSGRWEEEGKILPGKDLIKKYNAPNHYKVDLLNRELKIAIELDGKSHLAKERKEQDKRKDECLEELGYKVIRIFNHKLIEKFDEIVDAINNKQFDYCFNGKDCPVYLEVIRTEETFVNEKFVYDITVEGNHNFYANGILVHNCQDINPLQRELILKMIKPNGRLIAVGDDKQTIYSFQGSNLNSFEMLSSRPNTEIMPLSMTYRCGKKIVEAAKEIFPEGIEAYDGNEDGIVRRGSVFEAREGDYVLCRNNFPLVEVFIKLISQRKKAVILGKDFGKSILNILDKINSLDELDELLLKCVKLLKEEGVQRPTFHPRYIALQEKCDIIRLVYCTVGETFISTKELIEEMFGEDNGASAVTLTTIHKSKGLEADRVFFLQPDLIPSKYAQTELELYGERCLKFVAITRAKKELIFC